MTPTTKLPDQADDVTEETLDHESGLYRHTKRPEWGVAVFAWEKGDRRAYQFEDGRLRKFKKGYYSLLEPAEEVKGKREAVISRLEDAIEVSRDRDPPKVLEPTATFEEQIELFHKKYPEGFEDEQWIEDHRGNTGGRDLKRHREPVVAETQDLLSAEKCEAMISEGRYSDFCETVTGILGSTSLVPLKHVKVLRAMDPDEQEAFAKAAARLLHADEDYGTRFKAYLEVMTEVFDGTPSWRIATALPALMYPQEQVCVRRSAFIRQAATIAPAARYSNRTSLRGYKNYRRAAFAVRKRLEAADQKPRDLLDVHDFIWATLRNSALDDL